VKGKPANVIEKIVDGKMNKFYADNCLLEQPFVKNPDLTITDLVKSKIAELGENIVVRRFQRAMLWAESNPRLQTPTLKSRLARVCFFVAEGNVPEGHESLAPGANPGLSSKSRAPPRQGWEKGPGSQHVSRALPGCPLPQRPSGGSAALHHRLSSHVLPDVYSKPQSD